MLPRNSWQFMRFIVKGRHATKHQQHWPSLTKHYKHCSAQQCLADAFVMTGLQAVPGGK